MAEVSVNLHPEPRRPELPPRGETPVALMMGGALFVSTVRAGGEYSPTAYAFAEDLECLRVEDEGDGFEAPEPNPPTWAVAVARRCRSAWSQQRGSLYRRLRDGVPAEFPTLRADA